MATITNYDRITKTMELLRDGLKPFVAREMEAAFGSNWIQQAVERHRFPQDVANTFKEQTHGGDIKIILELMWSFWNEVFKRTLGHAERSLVSELREIRNRWAHQDAFSTDDTYRVMDSTERLLTAVSSPEARKVAGEKQRLMRERFEQQLRDERKKTKQLSIDGEPSAGLKPWREVMTPHKDVASGNYQQAEFAADLSQVHRGEATPEYNDPKEFFRRTYLTEGLVMLLKNALKRLCIGKGDPVMELQTNFGGGKTHSMLALYHLFAGEKAAALRGVEELVHKEGITELPAVKKAVLVGTALSPAQPQIKSDGTTVKTLWGELAWQLLGKDGYDMVADADKSGVSPGSDMIREIFIKTGGCLVLIDEWVAFVRQLYNKNDLSGGTFEANITFAQSLTEAARAVPKTLLVASIPASKIEIGGDGGEVALDQLKHTFGRMESPWRPASAEESFEIVRRRLFEDITDAKLFALRDAVIDAYCDLYSRQMSEFPNDCREGEYRRRMQACYPIHPELFDRLYNEWSSLDKFQRTRGVLRLMAAVIHSLWENNDAGLLIMPCSIPINDPSVQPELVRYLEDSWVPVIERDIDGPNSLPLRLDRDNPNMGRYSACRRVARTIYMASAPTVKTSRRGTDDRQIRLGCVQPGESVAIFGDALRRLTDQAMHLYVDKSRYWYSTQPSVLSLAKDRAAQLKNDQVLAEIEHRLLSEQSKCGDFARVHACPAASSDVADEYDARLVILGPQYIHVRNQNTSPAITSAEEIFMNRGNAPRQYRNTLVFLAAEKRALEDLDEAVRDYLAWQSIERDKGAESLNLDAFQAKQAETKRIQADETIKHRIHETWQCVIAPYQSDHKSDHIEWKVYKLMGTGSLAEKTAARLKREQALILKYAGTSLKIELDRVPLWRGDHVQLRQLSEDFARYVYLPRLQSAQTLAEAVEDGVRLLSWQTDSFAYADRWDDEKKRYIGLRSAQNITIDLNSDGVIVKSAIAADQLKREKDTADNSSPGVQASYGAQTSGVGTGPMGKGETIQDKGSKPAETVKPKRYYGSCKLDPTRMTRDAGTITDEVLQHLTSLLGADISVTLEIEANVPEGVPEHIVRIVLENSRTLKFEQFGFEEE